LIKDFNPRITISRINKKEGNTQNPGNGSPKTDHLKHCIIPAIGLRYRKNEYWEGISVTG
jgi:hypothetical protein